MKINMRQQNILNYTDYSTFDETMCVTNDQMSILFI